MSMFTATREQIATYLLGVCPFSIAFLVFLNSSVSFVITDLLHREHGVGDAVGNLGFADELVALVACPLWGMLSDRIGVRIVCVLGYFIVGLSLILFVQAKNVYPQLLLGRLFFSLGGSAVSTMVTAVLPTMSYVPADTDSDAAGRPGTRSGHVPALSTVSEQTITPARFQSLSRSTSRDVTQQPKSDDYSASSRIAGWVGMATGCGALLALAVFLPLPARFQKSGIAPGLALQYSYYTVAAVAIVLALVCGVGLRNLHSDKMKGWRFLIRGNAQPDTEIGLMRSISDASSLLYQALFAGFRRADIGLGYVGGFVARASSVGISLFVPLLINAAFRSSGLCQPEKILDKPAGLPDIKRRCPRAYIVAAEMTGVSQLVALLCAPLFGYWSAKSSNKALPLMFAATCGIIGYPLFAMQFDANDENIPARATAFISVCLIGISQIGAIVCSLGILSAGVLTSFEKHHHEPISGDDLRNSEPTDEESEPLLNNNTGARSTNLPLADLKGSVAGIYSFYGGAGILLLTKAGGALFDSTSRGAPFFMMAAFNGILLVVGMVLSCIGNLHIDVT